MFRVGQKVVCVDASANTCDSIPDWAVPNHVVKGAVYTIRGIHIDPDIRGYGVYLEEVVNPVIHWLDGPACEWPFNPHRFRPLVERKTDISIFTALLDPAKSKVTTDA